MLAILSFTVRNMLILLFLLKLRVLADEHRNLSLHSLATKSKHFIGDYVSILHTYLLIFSWTYSNNGILVLT